MLLGCRWPQVAADLPADLLRAAISISGLFELETIRRTPFLAPDLRLTAESARRLSPALLPAPAGRLAAVVGGDESEEFLRQNRLIRSAWGEAAVPVCEAIPGTNHFTVLHDSPMRARGCTASRSNGWASRRGMRGDPDQSMTQARGIG
jgi:arylformamidase